jgi:predicted dehydrogenase
MRFRVVVVGAAGVAHRWIQNALDRDDLEIVALVDVDDAAAGRVAEGYGRGWPVFRSAAEAIAATGANLVFNTTPSDFHAEVSTIALESGCDVFSEKPMVTREDDALALIRTVERTGRTLSVMQNRRHHPALRLMREVVESGELGPLGHVCIDFFRPGPEHGFRVSLQNQLILDIGIHALDAARFLVGADPVSVSCTEFNPPGSWTAGNAALHCLVEFDSGVALSYRAAWCAGGFPTTYDSAWRLTGTEGSVRWDGAGAPVVQTLAAGDGPKDSRPCVTRELEVPAAEPLSPTRFGAAFSDLRLGTLHREGLNEMLEALAAGRPSENDCRSNFLSLATVFAAIRSAASGRAETVSRPGPAPAIPAAAP